MTTAGMGSFAYTLSEHFPSKWRWRVYDLDGGVAGMGEAASRADAEKAISRALAADESDGHAPSD